MAYNPILATTTRLEAVNALLVSGGEAPVSSLVTVRPDVIAAMQLLDECVREVLSEGWRFNTEHGLELVPVEPMSWVSARTGLTETINIFVPHKNLLAFQVTQSRDQWDIDAEVRPPTQWINGRAVFYDRAKNRDGFTNSVLYINPVWLMDWEDIPQHARTLIYIRAMRRYLAQVVGDNSAAAQKDRDEGLAYRALKRAYGIKDSFNIFNNTGMAHMFGGRYINAGMFNDSRVEEAGQIGGGSVYSDVASVELNGANVYLELPSLVDEAVSYVTVSGGNVYLELPGNSGTPVVASMTVATPTVTLGFTDVALVVYSVEVSGGNVYLELP